MERERKESKLIEMQIRFFIILFFALIANISYGQTFSWMVSKDIWQDADTSNIGVFRDSYSGNRSGRMKVVSYGHFAEVISPYIGGLDTAYINAGDSLIIINVYGDSTIYYSVGGSGDDWGSDVVNHDNTLTGNGTIGIPLKVDTSELSTPFDLTAKLNISDTASMVSHFVERGDTATMLVPYINRGDTSSMLTNYIERGDTSSMLTNYIERGDTSAMLSNYLLVEVDGVIGNELLPANNLSDVSSTSIARINILPSISGNTLKVLRVNAGETDYELATISGGGLTFQQALAISALRL